MAHMVSRMTRPTWLWSTQEVGGRPVETHQLVQTAQWQCRSRLQPDTMCQWHKYSVLSTQAAYVKSLQPDVIDQVQCLWHMEHVARQTRQMLQSITLMLEVWFQVGSKTLLVLLASFYFSIFLGNFLTLVVVARNLAMLNTKWYYRKNQKKFQRKSSQRQYQMEI